VTLTYDLGAYDLPKPLRPFVIVKPPSGRADTLIL